VVTCSQRATDDNNWQANAEVFRVLQYTFTHPSSHGKRGRNEIRNKEGEQQGREERTEVRLISYKE
jgi:hypothetical protein